jgi:hypothetical protein
VLVSDGNMEAMPMRRVALALVVAGLSSPGLLMAQAPGSGWAVAPGPERTVRTLYWRLFDRTEIWTRILPKDAGASRRLPFELIFSATFAGDVETADRRKGSAPLEITILAQPSPVAALPIPSLSFVLVTDDGHRFDLVASGEASRPVSVGETCCAEQILARPDPATFRALARSKKLTGRVLGFECVLDDDDMKAVAEFARVVLTPGSAPPPLSPKTASSPAPSP